MHCYTASNHNNQKNKVAVVGDPPDTQSEEQPDRGASFCHSQKETWESVNCVDCRYCSMCPCRCLRVCVPFRLSFFIQSMHSCISHRTVSLFSVLSSYHRNTYQ